MKKTALLIGGTGTISMAITRLLAASGEWETVVLNRGRTAPDLPPGVTALTADINDPAAAEQALAGRTFDVVADFIAYTPDQVERDIRLFAGRTSQYMFISTASAYEKPPTSWPITESTPLRNPYWQYSADKIACEDVLVRRYRDDGFPMTIIRPSHTYADKNVPLSVQGKNKSWQVIQRMREGKPVIIAGDGTSLWTLTHADDFAVGFVGLMGNPRTLGHAFQIMSDDVLTWNGIYGHVAAALGVHLDAVHIASDALARANPELAGGLLGDKAHSAVFDTTKLRTFVPWFNPRIRFSDAVRDIVAAMLSTPSLQVPDPEFDAWCDRMIAAARG